MVGFVKVTKKSELSTRCGKFVKLGADEIALFRTDKEVFAVTNVCPHQHFSVLHQGELKGASITCPMHGTTFDLQTGQSTNGTGKLRKYEVRVVDDDIWVEQTERA